ncbi:hypothetical protein LCM10_19120 [Rossellomorea aquimaris]|uniref:BsuPI-related putative proteinase inhibitor n=1 Tax=Rossellomorea aquimaris TaxID=189382 RepID=UPI001CD1961C|nr:BsuPI-related putative proteinase inhibitor [Rossellomorea aquimaris]MCA1057070.1 hypothetical protein [Rossellomorea aquimaris]
MKKRVIALTGAVLIGLSGCGTADEEETEEVTVSTSESSPAEKGIVAGSMEPTLVEMDMQEGQMMYLYKIKNQTEREKPFVFPSGQKIDFEVTNNKGEVVYRDSENKMYTQAIEELTLKQGEEFTQKVALPKLDSGSYTLSVWLTAKGESNYKVKKDITIK